MNVANVGGIEQPFEHWLHDAVGDMNLVEQPPRFAVRGECQRVRAQIVGEPRRLVVALTGFGVDEHRSR